MLWGRKVGRAVKFLTVDVRSVFTRKKYIIFFTVYFFFFFPIGFGSSKVCRTFRGSDRGVDSAHGVSSFNNSTKTLLPLLATGPNNVFVSTLTSPSHCSIVLSCDLKNKVKLLKEILDILNIMGRPCELQFSTLHNNHSWLKKHKCIVMCISPGKDSQIRTETHAYRNLLNMDMAKINPEQFNTSPIVCSTTIYGPYETSALPRVPALSVPLYRRWNCALSRDNGQRWLQRSNPSDASQIRKSAGATGSTQTYGRTIYRRALFLFSVSRAARGMPIISLGLMCVSRLKFTVLPYKVISLRNRT